MEPTNHIKLIDGIKVYVNIRRNSRMQKLMNAYCGRNSLDFNSMAFLSNGHRILPHQTPEELDLEDEDEIDAVLYQQWTERININVKGQDGNVTLVCIDRSTQLKKLVKDYCDQHSVEDPTSITFWFDGNGLQGDHCPDEMHMDDEMDTISYDQSAHIKLNLDLNIKDKDGIEVYFNISRSTPLKKLMDFYGYRHCLDINGVAFLFNGRLVTAEQTPDELQMMDGDEIDVVFFDQIARMKLKVKCQDGNEIFFSINKSTHLKKLMNAYCNHHSVDFNSIGFMFNEHHVQAEQSPNEMQMVDGDEIDAIFYDQSRRINLKVKGQVGFEASFGINRSTRLKKLMDVYCCRYCFDFDGVAFLFNGCLVESEQTPDELGMENGDEMLAMLQLICV